MKTKTVAEVLELQGVKFGICGDGECSFAVITNKVNDCQSKYGIYCIKDILNQQLEANKICVVDVEKARGVLTRNSYGDDFGNLLINTEDIDIDNLIKELQNCVKFREGGV